MLHGPPREWLQKQQQQQQREHKSAAVLKQLYDRRRAGTRWVDFMAALLVEDACMSRFDAAPRFFVDLTRGILAEAHMGDLHGAGGESCINELMDELQKTLLIKEWAIHRAGDRYEHLKRICHVFEDRTEVEANPRYLAAVVASMGLSGRPRPA